MPWSIDDTALAKIVMPSYAIVLTRILIALSSALYANKFNTLFYHNINDGEEFGFNKNQVTPFNIKTPDGETLYAWHVLPIDIYTRNEQSLRKEARPSSAPVPDFTMTQAFGLLTQDPDARVVISCMASKNEELSINC